MASDYSDEFESHSEDEGVERSPKNDSHHSSGRHSLSRSPDILSGNSLTANPSTPSTPGTRRRKRRRNSTKPARSKASIKPKTPPNFKTRPNPTATDLSAITERSRSKSTITKPTPKRMDRLRIAPDSPLDRVLRVKEEKIRKTMNELAAREYELEEVRRENKLLKRVHHRHSKALEKFESAEADLPQILARHGAEVDAVKKRLKRTQEAYSVAERLAKERDEEIWKLKIAVNEVTKLSGDKHLLERDRLRSYLDKSGKQLVEQTKKATDLEKKIDIQEKVHVRDLREWKQRWKAMQQEAGEWKERYEVILQRLKEKEKEMEIMNIYSQRITKNLPRMLSSLESSEKETHHVGTLTESVEWPRNQHEERPSPSLSVVESVTLGTPSVVSLAPRPPSHPRPRNMPRRNSPLTSSMGGSSVTVTGKQEEDPKEESFFQSSVSLKAEMAVGPELSPVEKEEVRQTKGSEKSSDHSIGLSAEESSAAESLKREEGLLARLKAVDEQKGAVTESVFVTSQPPVQDNDDALRKKELLLAKLRSIDDGKQQEDQNQVGLGGASKAERVSHLLGGSQVETQESKADKVSQLLGESHKETQESKADRVSLLLSGSQKEIQESKADRVSQLLGGANAPKESQASRASRVNQILGGDQLLIGKEDEHAKQTEDSMSNISKTSGSHSSWKVDNMHSGRPANSTGENYYGIGGSSRKGSDGFAPSAGSAKRRQEINSGKALEKRSRPPLSGGLAKLGSSESVEDDTPKFGRKQMVTGHQGSLGLEKEQPAKSEEKRTAFPWDTKPTAVSTAKSFGGLQNGEIGVTGSMSLLPRREKVQRGFSDLPNGKPRTQWQQASDDDEDDDIEEVLL